MHHKFKDLQYQRATRQIRGEQRGYESQSAYTYYSTSYAIFYLRKKAENMYHTDGSISFVYAQTHYFSRSNPRP